MSDRQDLRRRPPIRVAYFIDMLCRPAGGTEGQLIHLVERLDRDRFSPRVFCLHSPEGYGEPVVFEDAPSEVLDLRVGADPRLPVAIAALAWRLRRERVDVVQTHFRDANLVGVSAARLARVPLVVSTRRGVPYWQSETGLRVLKRLNRSVHVFVANSEATRDRYVESEGLDPRRVEVIPNGLDPTRFGPLDLERRGRLRRELGLDPVAPVVGIVANLREVKGIDVLLRAFASVLAVVPEARLVVVGEGPDRQRLRAVHDELGLGERARWLGARPDVPDLLQAFDVGVLASHSESFSNSILEYLAAGMPVVVTDVGGAREAVRDGENGFVVPPADAAAMAARLIELLRRPGGARSWLRGPALDPRFGLAHMVQAHESLYERGLARR